MTIKSNVWVNYEKYKTYLNTLKLGYKEYERRIKEYIAKKGV